VLVVEDEGAILELARESLEELGYRVLTASSPQEAMRRCEEQAGEIHLLITDVVMPQMNGRELAERLRALRPGLKCLYMSGYTADVIANRGVLEQGVSFIGKPFSLAVLAEKVREVLEG
jgi:two-component system cell cycle sensor histidine kinase/response regulator CckA